MRVPLGFFEYLGRLIIQAGPSSKRIHHPGRLIIQSGPSWSEQRRIRRQHSQSPSPMRPDSVGAGVLRWHLQRHRRTFR